LEQIGMVEGELPAALVSVDPAVTFERYVGVSNLLARVIRERGLSNPIGGREYVRVEGWTLLGSLVGVFPATQWTRPVEGGYLARVEARDRAGGLVGAAEAVCLRSEAKWRTRDDYAVLSMAQTRATSKALRQPLGFVMQLAGFEPTPADEMPEYTGEARPAHGPQPAGRVDPVPDPEPEEGEWWEPTPDPDPIDEQLPAGLPVPAVAGPPATAGQLRKLNATFRDHRVTDRQSRLEFAREVIGRKITSSKELTGREVSQLLVALDSSEARTVAILEQLADPVEPEPGPELASPAQRTHLYQLLEQKNLDGMARLDLLSELVGHPVHAVDNLTSDEADLVVSILGGKLPLHTPP
jgi:hypothetical protein